MAFLDIKELFDAYDSASKYSDHWFSPFDEYERIAANLPSDILPGKYPKVTDGTLSALIAETPMRVWGQLQTGRVVPLTTGDTNFEEWKTALVNLFWTNRIIPNANMDFPFFTKLRLALHNSLIYGSQPAYSFMVSDEYYTGADFVLPYIKDVKMEPGKKSDRSCNYLWLDTHYSKLELRSVIERALKNKGSGWDVKALEEIYDSDAFMPLDDDQRPSDAKGVTDFGRVVTFSTCFHRGYKAPFYTIYPKGKEKDAPIRKLTNKNLTGDIPVNFMYHQQNLSNPYGIGQVEVAGPTQNMIDFFVAAHAFATQTGLEPIVKIKGDPEDQNLDLASLIFAPSQQWFTGDADVSVENTNSAIYNQFPDAIGLYKTNVMNQQGTTDASVSGSNSGNSQYSKTPAGVKYQQERTNARDNFLRQRCDEFVAGLAKNLINLSIQNTNGSEFVKASDEQREKLVAAGVKVPEEGAAVLIEFNELKAGEFDYDVDANSSIVKNDDDTKDRIVEILKILLETPNVQEVVLQDGAKIHVGELIKQLMGVSGLDNYEKIITPITDEEKAQIAAQNKAVQTQGMEAQQQALPAQAGETMQPPASAPPVEDQDQKLRGILANAGWDEARINAYLAKEQSV